MRVRLPSRRLYVGLRGVLAPEADVLAHAGVEQHRLLAHQADLTAQPAHGQLPDIDAVYKNLHTLIYLGANSHESPKLLSIFHMHTR